jgi:hypothetical protein
VRSRSHVVLLWRDMILRGGRIELDGQDIACAYPSLLKSSPLIGHRCGRTALHCRRFLGL